MNRGGGGEHQFLMLEQECWPRSGDRVRRAHVVASSERRPAALRLPRFSPNSCPTSMQYFLFTF